MAGVFDQGARKVCNLASIHIDMSKVTELKKLKDAIALSLRELDKETRWENEQAKMFLTLKFTKATCDGVIEIAANLFEDLPVVGKKLGEIKNAYGLGSVVATTVGDVAAGNSVDVVKTGLQLAQASAEFIPAKVGQFPGDGVKYLTKFSIFDTELLRKAITGKQEELSGKELYKLGFQWASDLSKLADRTDDKVFKKIVSLAKSLNSYNAALGQAFDEFLEMKDARLERRAAAKVNFKDSAQRIENEIDQIESAISECVRSISSPQAAQGVV